MQKIEISSTYYQELQTIHKSLVIRVPFVYVAYVYDDEGETTRVLSVHTFDGSEKIELQINGTSPGAERFLAHIREDARAKAYTQRKNSLHIQQVGRGSRPESGWDEQTKKIQS